MQYAWFLDILPIHYLSFNGMSYLLACTAPCHPWTRSFCWTFRSRPLQWTLALSDVFVRRDFLESTHRAAIAPAMAAIQPAIWSTMAATLNFSTTASPVVGKGRSAPLHRYSVAIARYLNIGLNRIWSYVCWSECLINFLVFPIVSPYQPCRLFRSDDPSIFKLETVMFNSKNHKFENMNPSSIL